jgi:hypothetical protein
MYDDKGKDGGKNIHEDGRVLGGLCPVPNGDDDDDDDDDDDLLKTTEEHTTRSRAYNWRHLLHFPNEQLLTSIYWSDL